MIRLTLLCGLLLPATYSAANDKEDVPKELQQFQGTWKLVKIEVEGKEPPGGLPEEVRFTFSGNKLTIKEGKGKSEEGTYSVDSKKDPTEIDLINAKSEKALGIYKLDKDGKLIVNYTKDPKSPRPKKFGETGTVLLILEKVKE